MKHSSAVTVEHVVVTSRQPFELLLAAIEAQMSAFGDVAELDAKLTASQASWEQIQQVIEGRMGISGFTIFNRVDQGRLLSLAGKPVRACQYTVGNPLLAIAMIEHEPEVALYAPLRLAVYEGKDGDTCISYDRFSSVVARFRHPEIARVAGIVQQKLEAVVAAVLGDTRSEKQS
jgi:uncharacterized protein (DUF302 family)